MTTTTRSPLQDLHDDITRARTVQLMAHAARVRCPSTQNIDDEKLADRELDVLLDRLLLLTGGGS